MNIVIPLAGLGTRFAKVAEQNPEFRKPKPLILVRGLPMVRWATGSLPFIEHPGQRVQSPLRVPMSKLIFVILQEHDRAFGIAQELKNIYSDSIRVIVLPAVTRGAAETAFQAAQYLDPEEDLLISDSDHFFDGGVLEDRIMHKAPDTVGVIPVFVPPNDGIARWSYSLVRPGSTDIIEEGEKDRLLMERGAYANIGAYYFSKAQYFLDEARAVIERDERFGEPGKAEFYIAPLYKKLLDRGLKVEAALTPEVWGLGTPEDLSRFLREYTGAGIRP